MNEVSSYTLTFQVSLPACLFECSVIKMSNMQTVKEQSLCKISGFHCGEGTVLGRARTWGPRKSLYQSCCVCVFCIMWLLLEACYLNGIVSNISSISQWIMNIINLAQNICFVTKLGHKWPVACHLRWTSLDMSIQIKCRCQSGITLASYTGGPGIKSQTRDWLSSLKFSWLVLILHGKYLNTTWNNPWLLPSVLFPVL
jgi:hypothetical protein